MTIGHDHRYALPPGHRLGEYRIEHYLGSGGFGITYLATDENLDLQVAIKEYLPSDLAMRNADNSVVVKTAEDEGDFEWGRERFLDEARSLARFNHPNIVRVKRFFEAHGTSYIVMDYVDGEPLSNLLKRKGTLTEAEVRQMVLPLADGLAEVHEGGLLHRDIKPNNILIRDGSTPVLIDFGSARQAAGMKSRSMTSVVTPGYAPLEQYATKSPQGAATDVYAFGAVLYRCVTGEVPDDATDRAIQDVLTPATLSVVGRYSKSLLAGIDAALEVRIEDRPQDIPAFLIKLGRASTRAEMKGYGSAYTRGDFVSAEDTHEGIEYGSALPALQHSAERGHADAEYCLGRCYYTGKGVPTDHAKAIQWFRKAAKQGHADAQHWLGLLYYRGHGGPKDFTQASQWFRKAAEQGLPYAQECMALMSFRGEGLPKDYEQTALWLRKANEQEPLEVLFAHHLWHKRGERTLEVFTQAVQWFHMAAEQGLANAQFCLGVMYLRGQGLQQDCAEAYRWFQAAARQGLASAQHLVDCMCLIGFGMPESYAQNLHWFRESAARELSGSRLNLHRIRENGARVPETDEQAVEWFHRAAGQGFVDAQYYMGLMYYHGEHVPEDYGQATLWFRRAAQQEFADAQYYLGLMLLRGEYVPEQGHSSEDGVASSSTQSLGDVAEQKLRAAGWLRKAAEQGLPTLSTTSA